MNGQDWRLGREQPPIANGGCWSGGGYSFGWRVHRCATQARQEPRPPEGFTVPVLPRPSKHGHVLVRTFRDIPCPFFAPRCRIGAKNSYPKLANIATFTCLDRESTVFVVLGGKCPWKCPCGAGTSN